MKTRPRTITPEAAEAFTPERVEDELRKEWWLNHGHTGLYGDDGETQCAMCLAAGQRGDFKRDPLNLLAYSVFVSRLARATEAKEAEELSAFIGHKGLGDEFLTWALARRAEVDRLLDISGENG